eukprot:8367557-Heterocapsa_arctica.AAC.1
MNSPRQPSGQAPSELAARPSGPRSTDSGSEARAPRSAYSMLNKRPSRTRPTTSRARRSALAKLRL